MQENISVTDSYSTGNAAQAMLEKLLQIYDVKTLVAQLNGVGENHWSAAILKRALANDSAWHRLSEKEFAHLQTLLPKPPEHHPHYAFRFIDLFAGIGGIRRGFESIGGQCVFTREWNKHAVRTYKANHYCDPATHHFNEDIRDITLSHQEGVSDEAAAEHIRQHIPEHDVLLAGFPCQPFSLAGVSKKNSLGRAHGFACDTQGTLFFDVVRIIDARRPAMFVLENVKNLKSHDKGKTFRIIMQTLDELGYDVADAADNGPDDPKIIDGKHFLPQHRERIVLVGFRRDLNLKADFTLRDISECFPAQRVTLAQLLDPMVEAKYILTPVLWKYLYRYAKKHQARGNGFGYGMVYPNNPQSVTRTLSARYYKDGAEILIDRGWDMATGEKDFDDPLNQQHRPRRLTPRECARLMGFEAPGEAKFRIPVSDTQAYRQFGNSVVVPVFAAVAKLLEPKIKQAVRCVSKRHNMVDVHDKATRSKNMRAIATRDTAIEKRLASLLTGQGLAFRVQDASLPGRPDFVVDEYRCVIFTHGCFWHHHHCYLFKVPATRTEFWLEKIGKNVERDRRDISRLQELGWRVLIVWECALRGREKLTDAALTERLEEWICGEGASAQIDTQGIHLLA
ncbi:TPA: DNA mismatch endonuclease Vsr [Escherichia coli]|nr:DNA mismatch endonuclease Vsr [Escherichia coli]